MAYLKEIAAASGCSIRTVARALADGGPVDGATREKVRQIAGRLGYQPNLAARSLRLSKSFEVIIVAGAMTELHVGKIEGLEPVLREAGYFVSIVFEREPTKAESLIHSVIDRRPAGVALLPTLGLGIDAIVERLDKSKIPYIAFDARHAKRQVDAVNIDRQQGVYEAILYLAAKGRKRIAFLGPRNDMTRVGGYQRALAQLHRKPIFFDASPQGDAYMTGRAAALNLSQTKSQMPDAVQALNDVMALGFMSGLHQLGLNVPESIAIVGFDDRLSASLSWPRLTTVAQPSVEIGVVGAEILLRKMRGERMPSGGWSQSLPTRLITRESA
jgi:LacI family transcriptional regulator